MKKITLITIGIVLSLSLIGQNYEVAERISIEGGDTTELLSKDCSFPVTDVDIKPKGRVIFKLTLFDNDNHYKMVLKCKTVDGYEIGQEGNFIFVLQHDVVGEIHLEIDDEGTVTKLYLDHDKEKNEFKTVLVLK